MTDVAPPATEPVTAPVKDEASETLHEAADAERETAEGIHESASGVIDGALDTASEIHNEASAHDIAATQLDTVGDALQKHIAEFHTPPPEPATEPEGEPALGTAVEITIPPAGEISPEVEGEPAADAPASRKRKVFGKSRR